MLVHTFLCTMILAQYSFAQSIILRPGIGFRYYNTNPNYKEPNYFDPSFSGELKFSEPAATIGIEILYPKKSVELVLTSQHAPRALKTFFPFAQMGSINYTIISFRQLQLSYNKFIDLNIGKTKSFLPFAGIGAGIGLNRGAEIYNDTSFTVYRISSLQYPNEYIDVDVRQKSLSKFSYSAVFKLGFAFKIKNIERARLYAVYNFGLNKIARSTLVYYHTNARYYGSSTSKGSQFSIMYSMPIYLKRKK